METLQNKIDFALIITATNANPNGDPLNGNRPRQDIDGHGEISDVCIKRKLRNRLQDMGEKVFVQSDDRCDDGIGSLHDRVKANKTLTDLSKGKSTNRDEFAKAACAEWIDVRSFGQVFAFKDDAVSVGVRGPVSIQPSASNRHLYIKLCTIKRLLQTERISKRNKAIGQRLFSIHIILL